MLRAIVRTVVKSTRQTQVKRHAVQHAKRIQIIHEQAHVVETRLGRGVGHQRLVLQQRVQQIPAALQVHVLLDAVGHLPVESLLLDHLLAHLRPGHLIQLVDGARDRPDLLLRHAADLEQTVEHLAVVDLDAVAALPAELLEDLGHDAQDLRVRHHGVELAGDVEVALVELAHAALADGRLVPAVDLGDVVALDAADVRVHGEPAGERHRQVVAQRADLAALILQVVDQLGVLAILAGQDLAQFEDGRVERGAAVALEDVGDGREDPVAEEGVRPGPVLGALGGLEVERHLVILAHRV